MKKLILLVISLIGLMSCQEEKTFQSVTLPIEIVNKQQLKDFDTLIVINGKDNYYLFDSTKNTYISTIHNSNNTIFLGVFIIGMLVGGFIVLICWVTND